MFVAFLPFLFLVFLCGFIGKEDSEIIKDQVGVYFLLEKFWLLGMEIKKAVCVFQIAEGKLTNSLMRSRPASEDKSPPSKFILICLLLFNGKVFTILIKGSFCW